jgi:hypothetical protein
MSTNTQPSGVRHRAVPSQPGNHPESPSSDAKASPSGDAGAPDQTAEGYKNSFANHDIGFIEQFLRRVAFCYSLCFIFVFVVIESWAALLYPDWLKHHKWPPRWMLVRFISIVDLDICNIKVDVEMKVGCLVLLF